MEQNGPVSVGPAAPNYPEYISRIDDPLRRAMRLIVDWRPLIDVGLDYEACYPILAHLEARNELPLRFRTWKHVALDVINTLALKGLHEHLTTWQDMEISYERIVFVSGHDLSCILGCFVQALDRIDYRTHFHPAHVALELALRQDVDLNVIMKSLPMFSMNYALELKMAQCRSTETS